MKKMLMIIIWGMAAIFPGTVGAQHFDYHTEESPAVGWNGLPAADARMTALGGISLTASDPFSGIVNPALVSSSKGILLGVTAAKARYEAFQYWGVNQGVRAVGSPLSGQDFNVSGLAGTFSLKGVRLSAGWYLADLLQFPSFTFRNDYEYEQYDAYSGLFSGREDAFFAAAAFKLGESVDVGIKLDYLGGNREVTVADVESYYHDIGGNWVLKDIAIRQQERHRSTVWVPTIGAKIEISPRWMIGAALVYPLQGKVKRTVMRTFENSTDHITVSDTQDAEDPFHRPVKVYLGTGWRIPLGGGLADRRRLAVAAESQYSSWSGYRYVFFGEEIPREMRNTTVLALGMEYGSFSRQRDFFLRVGFRVDPQPLMEPATTLKVLTGGMGFRFGRVTGDIGLAYYTGSAGGIDQNHLIVNSTVSIGIKGEKP